MGEPDAGVVVCDVGGLTRPDATLVDALARLELAARRCGCRVHLRNASQELQEILELAGLADVLSPESRIHGGREVERLEQVGVEKVRDGDDPTV